MDCLLFPRLLVLKDAITSAEHWQTLMTFSGRQLRCHGEDHKDLLGKEERRAWQ